MDSDGSLLGQIILLVILISVNAFFAMSEIAVISLNDAKLRRMAAEGSKKALQLVKLVDQPSRFLATIQVGVTLSGFFASAVAADSFAEYLVGFLAQYQLPFSLSVVRVICIALITLILSYFTLVLGELVPKRVAMQNYEKISMAIAGPLTVLSKIERPFVALLSASTNGLLRLLGIDPNSKPEEVTEEEIRMMVDVGSESGHIESSEKDMINNIFEFDDRTAEEMMSHRTEIVAIEQDTPLNEIIDVAVESGYSRIPVYEGDIDSIIGILNVKDLLELVLQSPDAPFDLKKFLRAPLYVPEAATGTRLMSEFQQKKIQMAVVVDEYGGTAGLVTMEDLLESIVGSIQDEYDDEEEEISLIGENLYLIDGLADLEDTCEVLGLAPDEDEEEEFETIGGFIVHKLGYIPGEEAHPEVQIENVLFTVVKVEERRIAQLRAEILAPEPVSESTGSKPPQE